MSYKQWASTEKQPERSWVCGFCGKDVAGDDGFKRLDAKDSLGKVTAGSRIYICPNCAKPTYFGEDGERVPLERFGRGFKHVPEDVKRLYDEITLSFSAGAYTASVLASRKMLVHLAVQEGAPRDGMSFKQYVEYLESENIVPRSASGWVDYIRSKGNETTHELVFADEKEAKMLAVFIENMLLTIYEFPAMLEND